MEFTFKNFDKYVKLYHEPVGDIQPKFWYRDMDGKTLLVKRQHSEKTIGSAKKSKMYNHYGEYFGYLLNKKANIATCPVELVTLHDTKNKYSQSTKLFRACASKSLKESGQEIYAGEMVISKFKLQNPQRYSEILNTEDNNITDLKKGTVFINSEEDNVDIVIASIVHETREYEKALGIRTEQEIKRDINNNLNNAIEMIVADCIFGNSDRHSFNWSMIYDKEKGTVGMYPNYDNEAVLGLRKTEVEIKRAVEDKENLSKYAEKECFSRMGFCPLHSGVSYKNMLEHLVNRYSMYAIPAMKKITTLVSEKDIENLYSATKNITTRSEDSEELTIDDELPEEYEIFGTSLYKERSGYAKNLIKLFEKKQQNIKYKEDNEK